jgi:cytochrome c oxidase subunit 2
VTSIRDRGGRGSRPLRRVLTGGVLTLGLVLGTAGCSSTAFTRLGWLPPVTKQGQVALSLWQGDWVAAWIVGAIVWFGILWAIIFHRKRSEKLPDQVRYNLPIEILYTVLPFIMIGVIFFYTARDENYITALPKHPDVIVNVTGFQWSWQFQYPQYPVTPKGAPATLVTETGQMWNPALPASQQNLPTFEIPVGETVQFNLTSIDVVHSFWVVPFEFKRDVIPGYANHFAVTPTTTGTFIGHCSELCGTFHSRMLFQIKIVTAAQFKQWIHAEQVRQSTGGGA